MYYYLSIGTNIHPEDNAVRIVQQLCLAYGPILLYPFAMTEPVNIDTQRYFLNTLAVLHTDANPVSVKQRLNSIESALGRDKSDPLSSQKDRAADIDILATDRALQLAHFTRQETVYLQKVLGLQDCVDLSCRGLPAIDRPTAINLDRGTGHIVIVDQQFGSL